MRKDFQQIVMLIEVLFSELGDFLKEFIQLSLDPVDSFVKRFGNQGHKVLARCAGSVMPVQNLFTPPRHDDASAVPGEIRPV
jgi:hypothetical protein